MKKLNRDSDNTNMFDYRTFGGVFIVVINYGFWGFKLLSNFCILILLFASAFSMQ